MASLGIASIAVSSGYALDPATRTAFERAFKLSGYPRPSWDDLRDLTSDFNRLISMGQGKIDIVIIWKKAGVTPMIAAIVVNALWSLRGGQLPPDPDERPSFSEIIAGYKQDVVTLAKEAGAAVSPFGNVLWPVAIIAGGFFAWKIFK